MEAYVVTSPDTKDTAKRLIDSCHKTGVKISLSLSDPGIVAGFKDELKSWMDKKIDTDAPHEIFLILDATTGQNAIKQAEEFKKISPITGVIMTKLDGTAKGGILLAVGKKFKIPIVALGMGEKEDDFQMFNAKHFAKAMTADS